MNLDTDPRLHHSHRDLFGDQLWISKSMAFSSTFAASSGVPGVRLTHSRCTLPNRSPSEGAGDSAIIRSRWSTLEALCLPSGPPPGSKTKRTSLARRMGSSSTWAVPVAIERLS